MPRLPSPSHALLDLWLRARASWVPVCRVAIPETVLLSAMYGSVEAGLAGVGELHRGREPDAAVESALTAMADVFSAGSPDVSALLDAWDVGASCPFGRGLLPLSALRTDVPMLERYGLLDPRARLVLLAVSNEAGHRPVRADAGVLAHRTGLTVTVARRMLEVLVHDGWLARQTHLAPRVVTVVAGLFLPFSRGA